MTDRSSTQVKSLDEFVGVSADRLVVSGWNPLDGPTAWTTAVGYDFSDRDIDLEPRNAETALPARPSDRSCVQLREPGLDWFGNIIVLPRSIALGNILGTVQIDLELYNSYRDEDRTFSAFTNNTGDGAAVIDLPSLPETVLRQDSIQLTYEVTTNGPPTIDATLDFTFDTGSVELPVTGTRVVIFPFRPERPITETLEFLTDIITSKNGREQRIALRKNPRQRVRFEVFAEEGREAARLQALLFDWQSRVFGLPIWWEPSVVTADAAIGSTTVSVNTTAYADLRVGGIALLFRDDQTFEALEVSAVNPTSIEFASPTAVAWSAGDEVFPVRTAVTPSAAGVQRSPVNLDRIQLDFLVNDNDANLGDTSAFSEYSSRVLLDDPNFMSGSTTRRSMERQLIIADNDTGLVEIVSTTDRGRFTSVKGAYTKTRKRLWEYRRLLHALGGRQTSFYLPTFRRELVPNGILPNGGTSLPIENIGYDRYIKQRSPLNVIRVLLTDGTVLVRGVISSSELSATSEQLGLDSTWPREIDPSEVERIDFLELVRLDSDTVRIRHGDTNGQADITFPVRTLLT